MITFETARHQVAIAGRATDFQTNQSLAGALVQITAAPAAFMARLAALAAEHGAAWAMLLERPDRAVTGADGHFHYLDLPDGPFTLMASLPGSGTRYGTQQVQVSISRDATGTIIRAAADVALPPTALSGQVTRQDGTPLGMAEVRVKGSGERDFSDRQGRYLVAPLEIGTRAVAVSAQGFTPVTGSVQLTAAGTKTTANFTLTALSP
jgi:hypothetical protein